MTLGTADAASGHINAFENMSFNIDTDNDDTNRFFEFGINGSSGAGTELMRLTEATQLGIGSSAPDAWSYTNPVLTISGGSTANNYVAFNLGAYSTSSTGILGDINFTQFASDGTTGAERAIIRSVNDGATDSVALKFYTTATGGAVTERMKISSAGVVELASGQLKFPASQNASSDANTLDDYEEGTFTVTNAGDASGTFSAQTGEYVKIGSMVHVRICVTVNANFASANMGGLPFTCNNSASPSSLVGGFGVMTGDDGDHQNITASPSATSTNIILFDGNNANDTHLPTTAHGTYRMYLSYMA